MKILIVDDEQLDLFITKKLLSMEFEAEGFTSFKDALGWAKNNNFDVVLIDYYLGTGLHAPQVLQELIAIKGNSFKAFVLSNHVDDKQTLELKEAGFEDVIYKPITMEKFKGQLKSVNLQF